MDNVRGSIPVACDTSELMVMEVVWTKLFSELCVDHGECPKLCSVHALAGRCASQELMALGVRQRPSSS